MGNIFDYEFDGPRTVFTRHGAPVSSDEVVAALNEFARALQELELITARWLHATYNPDWTRAHRVARDALEYAEINSASKGGQQ